MQPAHNNSVIQLRTKREKLISAFLKSGDADFQLKLSSLLDEYFIQSFEHSMVGPRMDIYKKPYAMIALGGYGRQEQCIRSDVDLLFLFEKNVPAEAEELIREMIYPLWDLGMEVGHATRSLRESIKLAGKELDVFTAMLDARFLCGMSPLYTEMMERLSTRLISGNTNKLTAGLIERNRERHLRFGDSTYRLEPNLKEGQGGLRDYHTMLWIARIKGNLKSPRDLEYHGYLSHDEYQSFRQALEFIWQVRNRLHQLSGRKTDQLHFEHQQKIAEILKFRDGDGQLAVERFLGCLHEKMEYIKQHNLVFLAEMGCGRKSTIFRRAPMKKSKVPGLEVIRNMINFVSLEHILAAPALLIRIFEESARLQIPLSSEARRVVREFAYLVNKQFRRDKGNIRIFETILLTPAAPFNVLNEMLNTGLLVRLIPEFRKIVNRIQFDEYHLFPVDRHSLHTVRTLKSFGSQEESPATDLCRSLYKELGQYKKLLLWSALLHDIGKGEEGHGHSARGAEIAGKILARTGYDEDQIATVVFLVKEHLFLIKTATRRDINDEETSIFCARRIRDIRLLKMLYLLTVADSIATGPKAWNDWSAALLRDLFFKVLNILEQGELASREAVEEVRKKKIDIVMSASTREDRAALTRHFELLPPRYLLYTPAAVIPVHMELYRRLGGRDFIWRIDRDLDLNTRTVTICAKDRPGLFSRISGVFTLNGLDILNAEIHTWRKGIALDIFTVRPPVDLFFEEQRWARAEKHLQAALTGELDLGAAVREKIEEQKTVVRPILKRPTRVEIDNEGSSFFTIVEVFTHDAPGLLFRITDVLFKQELDVWIAKIATKVDQVVDVFYVRDLFGQKVDDPHRVERVRLEIENALASMVGWPEERMAV
ncbi:MAG: [protein-PII] uridylyltransferase [Thermodesulfobacteriota bacterium]